LEALIEKSIGQFETIGYSSLEANIVVILLKSEESLSITDITEQTDFTKHQIYRSLNRLHKENLIEVINTKPKRYITNSNILKQNIVLSDQKMEAEINRLRNATQDEIFHILGMDSKEVDIYLFLINNIASRNKLADELSISYEKARNATETLFLKNIIQKHKRGKEIHFISIPIEEVIEYKIKFLENQLKDRISIISNILININDKVISEKQKISITFSSHEKIHNYMLDVSIDAKEIFNSLFIIMDYNFTHWKNLIEFELNSALNILKNDVQIKWLVCRSFISIFKDLDQDLIKQVLKSYPEFSIRVSSGFSDRTIIIDEDLLINFSKSSQLLDKSIVFKDKNTVKLKKSEFLAVWDNAHDFRPLIHDNLHQSSLIAFMDKKIDYSKIQSFNFALLGNKGVGKTSLVQRLKSNHFDPTLRATLGILVDEVLFRIALRSQEVDKNVKLIIYDFAGQDLFRNTYKSQISEKHGFCLVFALNDLKSFKDLEIWMELIKPTIQNNTLITLIGAKSDLNEKNIDEDLIWDFRKKYRVYCYYETSALTGENVDNFFEEVADKLSSQMGNELISI
jgi:small GTP-binding protein